MGDQLSGKHEDNFRITSYTIFQTIEFLHSQNTLNLQVWRGNSSINVLLHTVYTVKIPT